MRLIDADALIEDIKTVNPIMDDKIEWGKRIVNAAPTIDTTKAEAFVDEIIGYIFAYPDDYIAMETLCRKLYKHGLIDKKDGEWTCNFIEKADAERDEYYASMAESAVRYFEDEPQTERSE